MPSHRCPFSLLKLISDHPVLRLIIQDMIRMAFIFCQKKLHKAKSSTLSRFEGSPFMFCVLFSLLTSKISVQFDCCGHESAVKNIW